MISVTNVSERSTTLPQKGKDSVEIQPGETRSINIEADNPHLVAKRDAGIIQIDGERKSEATPTGRKPTGEAVGSAKPE